MKKIIITMMVVMVVLTGLVWYAKNNNIHIPGLTKDTPSTNWQWSNDWNNPAKDNGAKPDKPIGPNKDEIKPQAPEIVLIGYQEAMKRSAAEDKPVLVMFTASWCSWCEKFKKEVLTDSAVKIACSKYLFTMIDADQEKAIVRKFGVTGLPSFVITNSREQKLKFQDGFMDVSTFIKFVDNQSVLIQPKFEPRQPLQPPLIRPNQPQPLQQQDRRFLLRRNS